VSVPRPQRCARPRPHPRPRPRPRQAARATPSPSPAGRGGHPDGRGSTGEDQGGAEGAAGAPLSVRGTGGPRCPRRCPRP